jgi:phosphate:Na+ symporter
MSLSQSIGIFMGAGVGTTVTAQIVAFKVTHFALVAIIIGFGVHFFATRKRTKRYGTMILGLGLVFYGMNMMGDATRPLRDYQPFIEMLAQMDNRLWAILLSAAFTALVQSSSATTGVIIVLGSQGLISLEQGISLVLGANIGTCVTALLASIGKQRDGVRAAMIHVAFNVAGVLIWFGFIDELSMLSRWLSPAAEGLAGSERLAAEMPRQIANAHTLFNLGNTLIFIWFTGAFAWFVTRLLPDQPETGPGTISPKYLNDDLVTTPALALDAARREIMRMAGYVEPMVQQAGPAVLEGSRSELDHIKRLDGDVDVLHASIVRYLGKVSREQLTLNETESLHDYLKIATLYESIGDVIETDLVHLGRARIKHNVRISKDTQKVLYKLEDMVVWAVKTATEAVNRGDVRLAQKVIGVKEEVNEIAVAVSNRLLQRLIAEDPHRTATYRVESQLVDQYKRIYYFAKRIAKLVGEQDAVDEEALPEPA